jgi:hypothetical protein
MDLLYDTIQDRNMKFEIHLTNRAVVTVTLAHLFKERWIKYFGSVENVKEFIKNYK